MKRNQDGFTLVEMMVTIVIGSLVTLAATTVLLLGLRINNRSTQTVTRQNTARVVITMLENLVQGDDIASIDVDMSSWTIKGEDDQVLAKYVAVDGAIYTGGSDAPILENVLASNIVISENKVLTFSLETEDGSYNSSVYCRTFQLPADESETEKPNTEESAIKGGTENQELTVGRKKLLEVLTSQHRLIGGGPNRGLILNDKRSTGTYYSEWYVGGYDPVNKPGWNADTPWCACFVSWGLSYYKEVRDCISRESWNIQPASGIVGGVAFANVDFFANYFKNPTAGQGQQWKNATGYIPIPGDIIFIDWDGNRDDPAHVGVVLEVDKDDGGALKSVTTIEGNSAGIVAVRKYTVGENYDIVMGYGIIDWLS